MDLKQIAEFLNSQNDGDKIQVIYTVRNGGHVTVVPLKLTNFRFIPECDAMLIETEAHTTKKAKTKQEKISK